MSSFILERSCNRYSLLSQNPRIRNPLISFLFPSLSEAQARTIHSSQSHHFFDSNPKTTVLCSGYGFVIRNIYGFSSYLCPTMKNTSGSPNGLFVPSSWVVLQSRHFSSSNSKDLVLGSGSGFLEKNISGFCTCLLPTLKNISGSHECIVSSSRVRLFGSQAAIEPSTSDGLTVEGIIANQWTILNEGESDWRSHASAIAQSIQVIKKRLQWKKLLVRLELLSAQLNKPDLWDHPIHAGKISREHGSLMGRMKEVKAFEQELLEHIDMIKLAREEKDSELESVGPQLIF